MSKLIRPVIDSLIAIVKATEFGELPPFIAVKAGVGLLINPPSAWVAPGQTSFPGRGEGNGRNQVHAITIRMGIGGPDPESLIYTVMDYVQRVDAALQAADPQFTTGNWPDYVLNNFIAGHNYGPCFAKQGGGMSYWPEIYLNVEVEETS